MRTTSPRTGRRARRRLAIGLVVAALGACSHPSEPAPGTVRLADRPSGVTSAASLGGGGLVVFGTGGRVWTSTDGRQWEDQVAARLVFAGASVVAAQRTIFGVIAVGADTANGGDGAVFLSPDGRVWQRVQSDGAFAAPGRQGLAAVFGQPDRVTVLGGDSGHPAMWTSTDGLTWTRDLLDETVFAGAGPVVAGCVSSSGYIALGASRSNGSDVPAAAWRSTTAPSGGPAWSRIELDGATQLWACASQGQTVAVVGAGPGGVGAAWTSTDGTTWRASGGGGFESGAPDAVVAPSGGAGFLAAGRDGSSVVWWTSADGGSWVTRGRGGVAGGPAWLATTGDVTVLAATDRRRASVWLLP